MPYQNTSNRSLLISTLGALCVGIATFFGSLHSTPEEAPTVPPIAIKPPPPPEPPRDVIRAKFFDEEVQPQIAETDILNREAADRCVQRLHQLIDGYHDGVDPFVEDLTSMSTRLGIVRRMPGNWWHDDNRIEVYVQDKFELHLFSQEKLFQDIARILDDFRGEVDANQKRMLVNIQASLTTADLPEVNLEQYKPFFASVAKRLKEYSAAQGANSVYSGLMILVASEIGSYTTITIVGGLLARFGTAAAASAAAGVGATAGAAATGAGGGTLAGPVGTVVGLGVGLAVGLTIDWWMTEKFEAKLSLQMNQYLDSLENALMEGSNPPSMGQPTENEGVVKALPIVCDQLLNAYRERFYEQIVTMEKR